ncbi:MAG TPA: sugar phosphate isomerase/epimerase [Gemmatimonadaceae bacterium]|nr:sugar phosphate isomerase/epimerase [Gemmatimonadaceae bacterium]
MTPGDDTGAGDAPAQLRDRTDRRAFLRASAVALGGMLAGVSGACAGGSSGRTDSATAARSDSAAPGAAPAGRAIGIQLYTVRTLMERDVEGTLEALAGVGYREVEFAGYFGREPRTLRQTLDRLQLAAPATHVSLDELRAHLPRVFDAAQTLGHRYVVCPWIDEKERTLAGYRRIAGELNRWGAACRDRGMRLAYHNHEFEFARVDNVVPYDLLLAETDPAVVFMELDLFWATKAGADPLALFTRQRRRFPLWHVKDMRGVQGPQEMVAVGEGDIDFGRIFAAAQQSGMEHFFVEHDNPTDPLASARTSYRNLARVVG